MEKSHKSESYIIKEAQNIIEDYVKRKEENDGENEIWKEKYERLKVLTIGIAIAQSIMILVNIILK